MDKKLAKEINNIAKNDQKMRKKGKAPNRPEDIKNTILLKGIIRKHGWPTIDLVGKKASKNAWLIVQHADHDRKFQNSILRLLKRMSKSEIDKMEIAFLTDRLLVASGKKQKFGTQFRLTRKGVLKMYPIEEKKGIDTMRKRYNLPSIKEYQDDASEFNLLNE